MRINNPKHLEPGLTPISRQKWLQVYFLSQVRRLDGDLNRADHWGWLSGHRDRGLSNKILIARAANFDKYYLLPCPGDGWRCYAIIPTLTVNKVLIQRKPRSDRKKCEVFIILNCCIRLCVV